MFERFWFIDNLEVGGCKFILWDLILLFLFFRIYIDIFIELRYLVGFFVDSQFDYRIIKVIRRLRRGRMGVRRDELKVIVFF